MYGILKPQTGGNIRAKSNQRPASDRRELLRGIRDDAQWLVDMVENLLSVTRLDNGDLRLNKTDTVLEELIDAVLVKFRKRCPDPQRPAQPPLRRPGRHHRRYLPGGRPVHRLRPPDRDPGGP